MPDRDTLLTGLCVPAVAGALMLRLVHELQLDVSFVTIGATRFDDRCWPVTTNAANINQL